MSLLKVASFGFLALFTATAASAQEMKTPRVILSKVDWEAAAKSLPGNEDGTVRDKLAKINSAASARFPGIEKSTVPVLLPIDLGALLKDAGKPEAETSDKYFGGFHPSKFFQAGPAGYGATFFFNAKEAGLKIRFVKPIEVEIYGAAFVYDLDHLSKQEVFTPKELQEDFPGIRRVLRQAYVWYPFERFGVPYVLAIQCYDHRPTGKYLVCREASEVAERFLGKLQVAGGTPAPAPKPELMIVRPERKSPKFTYYSPGNLIENSGWNKMGGRTDYTVYTNIRFPIRNAPAFANSQSFMHWGDCYRKGKFGRTGKKGANYRCKLNDKPLVFFEAAPENYSYPWRDNFCETRDTLVGQCPGGVGHQGQDIRPVPCVLVNDGADRCEPYHSEVVAPRDGVIWRNRGNLAAFVSVNTRNELVRFRFMHMYPQMMDDDGLLSGRRVIEGETVGKVGNYGDFENGTSYHLHFDTQVFTRDGWVWVNPYMTLVSAYERLINGRGTEIKTGDPAPPIDGWEPTIAHPSLSPPEIVATTEEAAAAKAKPDQKKAVKKKQHRNRKAKQ